MKTTLFSLIIWFCLAQQAFSQSVPVPAPAQKDKIILMSGVAHLGNGQVIENSVIIFEKGKISLVEDATRIKIDGEGATIINIFGKHVYPGLIAPITRLGLVEVEAVRATRDFYEVGQYNPNIRAAIAYNTDSRIIPTIRSNGILLAQTTPAGGVISGQSSVMQLDAWNWEDALYLEDDGIHLNWPSLYSFKGWWAEPGGIEKNKEYNNQLEQVYRFFEEARAYAQNPAPAFANLKMEAMKAALTGKANCYIYADNAHAITDAINLGKKAGVKTVIVGGKESWRVTALLKETKTPVILGSPHKLPVYEDDDVDQVFKTAKMLHEAGVLFCLADVTGSWQQRNLPFLAGTLAGHGLSKEEALQTVTQNTARILGIESRTGTLESGKDANIIISEGDLLDMKTNSVVYAFIQGRQIDLGNKQKALYNKFSRKYGHSIEDNE